MVTGLNAVIPTGSGLINKTKLGEASVVKTDTFDQRLIISDVVANGDKLGYKTESLVSDVLKADPNFKILDAKYGANNGLDHVVQYTDKETGKLMTMVIDSKQLAKNGTTSLDPQAAGGVMQLSDARVLLNYAQNDAPITSTRCVMGLKKLRDFLVEREKPWWRATKGILE